MSAYPIKYPDDLKQKQVAFENACVYLYYGSNRGEWKRQGYNEGLSEEDSNAVWREACEYMASLD